jgi:hypothetical protein
MRYLIAITLLFLPLMAGCGGTISVKQKPPVAENPDVAENGQGVGENGNGVGRLGIPPGHLPPPGSCRVWIPGQPPGRQSPPGDCETLAASIPPGAWLVSRPLHDPGHVEVMVYDERKPGLVIEVQWYEVDSGEPSRKKLARGGK